MSRIQSTSVRSLVASDSFSFCTLITLGTGGNTLLLTDNDKDVISNFLTFTSSSAVIGLSEVQETSSPSQGGINLTFSGVDQSMVSYFLGSDYVGKYVKIERCILSASNTPLDSFNYFVGTISNFQIADTDKTSEVTVECKSHWEDFNKKNGRRTNHNSQQLHFAGDEGFEFGAKTIKDIRWGKA